MTKHTYCPRQGVPFLVGDGERSKKRVIVKARCKQWDCPYCAEINRYEHYNRIANGIAALEKTTIPMSFVTITCHEKWRGQSASVKNWRKNKDKLLARYRRRFSKDFTVSSQYVYIPEFHKDETVHIHGIFLGNFGERWWKDNARESGLGYMATSEKLTSVLQAINYCTKYMVKQMGIANPVKGFRRICYSQGFPAAKHHPSDFDWRMLEREETIKAAIVEGIFKGYTVRVEKMIFSSTDDLL